MSANALSLFSLYFAYLEGVSNYSGLFAQVVELCEASLLQIVLFSFSATSLSKVKICFTALLYVSKRKERACSRKCPRVLVQHYAH